MRAPFSGDNGDPSTRTTATSTSACRWNRAAVDHVFPPLKRLPGIHLHVGYDVTTGEDVAPVDDEAGSGDLSARSIGSRDMDQAWLA